ncbi:MAG TPA: cupredoxin domain-containing protein [Miltoncostaeaceae bacterium]|nr:cupredoxin domain-containing protein [Miltoncostaeaceae bacterium]
MIALAQHPATPDVPAAAVRTVAISDAGYAPSAVVVAPGTTVTWTQGGRTRHTVTADGGAFHSPTLIPGDRFTVAAPTAPGVYAYHCTFHAFMRGTVTVSLVSLAVPPPVTVGGRPALSGTVPEAAEGSVVHLERRVPGAWEEVGVAATGSNGAFSLAGPQLSARTAFRAVVGDAVSPSIRAVVQPAVVVTRDGARVAVRVRPAGGGVVHLEQLDLDTYRWEMVAERRLSAGRARFTLGAPGVYRAMVEARAGLSDAASRVVQYKPGAFRE